MVPSRRQARSLFLASLLTASIRINANPTSMVARALNNQVDDCIDNRNLWENCDDGTPKTFRDGPHRGLNYLTECPSIHMFLAPDGDCDRNYRLLNNNDLPSLPGYLYLDGDKLDTGGWDKFEEFCASTDVTFTASCDQHPAVCFRTTSWITFKGFELNGKYIAATDYISFSDKSLEGGNVPALQNGGIGYVEDGEWLKFDVGYVHKGTYAVKYYLSRLQASCTNPHLPPCPTPPPAGCRNPTPAPSAPPAPATLPPSAETPTSPPSTPPAPATLTPTPPPVVATPATLQPSIVETPTVAPTPATLQPSIVQTPTSAPAPVVPTPATLQPSIVQTPTSAPAPVVGGCPTSCTVTNGGLSFPGICSVLDLSASRIDVGTGPCGSGVCKCWIDILAPGLCGTADANDQCSNAADSCATVGSTQPVDCGTKAICACIPVSNGAACNSATPANSYNVCSNGNPDGCRDGLYVCPAGESLRSKFVPLCR